MTLILFGQHVASLLLLAAFPLPGMAMLRALKIEGPDSEERRILRIAFGYALGIILLVVCARIHLGLFAGAYALLFVWAGWAAFASRASRRGSEVSPELRALLLIAAAYLVIRSVPAILNPLPVGWDPYFHLLLADRISQVHHAIHDWMPYDSIRLNYPIGPHLLLGLIGWLGQMPVHVPFKMAIPWFTAITGLEIFAVLSLASGNRRLSLFSAVAYLFTADYGSFGYAIWGGLPNLMGMTVFLALIGHLAEFSREGRKAGRREIGIFAVLLLGLCLLHHHSMLTAGLVLAWVFVMCAPARALIWKGGLLTAIAGAPYFHGYLHRAANLSSSGIAGFNEGAMSPRDITGSLSPWYFFAVVFGALIFFRKRKEYALSPVVLAAIGGFLAWFVVGDYLIRVVTIILFHKQVAPFTPSRFLTDAVMLLSFFAGVFFTELGTLLALSRRQVLALILVGFIYLLPVYRDLFAEMVPIPLQEAYSWIRDNSQPDAWVLDGRDIHTSYLTRRASSGIPIPTSEFAAEASYGPAIQDISRGLIPELARGRELFAILRGTDAPPAGFRVVWTSPDQSIRVTERAIPPNLH